MWSLACELIVAGRQRIHRATAEVASEPEALSPIAGCAKGVSVFSHRSHLKRSVLVRAALTATIANERQQATSADLRLPFDSSSAAAKPRQSE
jgi:hypothetical protein